MYVKFSNRSHTLVCMTHIHKTICSWLIHEVLNSKPEKKSDTNLHKSFILQSTTKDLENKTY